MMNTVNPMSCRFAPTSGDSFGPASDLGPTRSRDRLKHDAHFVQAVAKASVAILGRTSWFYCLDILSLLLLTRAAP